MNENKIKIEISTLSIIKVILVVASAILLYYIRSTIGVLLIVLILAAGFSPLVENLVGRKVPRVLAVSLVYLLLFLILAIVVYIIVPPLVEQISSISTNIPYYTDRVNDAAVSQFLFQGKDVLNILGQSLSSISSNVISSIFSIFGGAAVALTILVLVFYILIGKESVESFIKNYLPEETYKRFLPIYDKISLKFGSWFQGQVILALSIGVITYIVLLILGIKYALALAVLAAVLEIVPIIGPIVSGIVAIFIAFMTGAVWWQVIAMVILYLVIQQLESQFLVPKVMGKAVGLSPIFVIIALMVGGQLAGATGAILSLPLAAGVSVLLKEWYNLRK